MRAYFLLMWSWPWIAPASSPASSPVPAERVAPVRLTWEAPPTCPDVATVRQQTERLLGRPLADPRHPQVDAVVTVRHRGTWSAELRLATASGQQSRTLQARSCEALAEVTALLLALAVDPTAHLPDPPARAGPEPPPEPAAAPEPVAPEPVAPEPVAPVVAPKPVAAPMAAPPLPGPRPRLRGPRGFLAAAFAMNWGALPGLGLGVLAAGGLRWRHARVLAAASYSASRARELDAAPTVRVGGDQWWAALAGCATLPRGRVELPLCAGWYAGAVRVRASGLASGGALALPWTGAMVDTGVRVLVHPRVALGLGLGAQIPVLRPTFEVVGLGTVHQTRAVVAHGQLGLEIRLP